MYKNHVRISAVLICLYNFDKCDLYVKPKAFSFMGCDCENMQRNVENHSCGCLKTESSCLTFEYCDLI